MLVTQTMRLLHRPMEVMVHMSGSSYEHGIIRNQNSLVFPLNQRFSNLSMHHNWLVSTKIAGFTHHH